MPIESFDEKYAGSRVLEDFTAEEGAAFAELGTLVVMADRQVTLDEVETLTDKFIDLAFDGDEAVEALGAAAGETVREKVTDLLDDEEALDDYIRRKADVISEAGKRETLLEMLATVAYSDGLVPSEKDVCFRIGRAFGFPREMVKVTFDEIRKGHG